MMYIDDGHIFARGPTYEAVERRLMEYYTECYEWCLRAGLTIELEKTEIFFFSASVIITI